MLSAKVLTDDEIAKEAGRSAKTIWLRLNSIAAKLNAKNRTVALAMALVAGILEVKDLK